MKKDKPDSEVIKYKCLKIGMGGEPPYFIALDLEETMAALIDVFEDIDEHDLGTKLVMEVVEMTESELEALPEFEGF